MARVAIGPHGSPWTLATARAEARKLLGRVENAKALGDPTLDPAIARKRRVKRRVAEGGKECVEPAERPKQPRTG